MRNALRSELRGMMNEIKTVRKPALRRSRREGWLYATDALALATEEEGEALMERLCAAGWEILRTEAWTDLRKPCPEPPEGWHTGGFGPEADCCRRLLERHAVRTEEGSTEAASLLIRAAEEGTEALERACRTLHRQWAERLRLGKGLPEISTDYFGGNENVDSAYRACGVSDRAGERIPDCDGSL